MLYGVVLLVNPQGHVLISSLSLRGLLKKQKKKKKKKLLQFDGYCVMIVATRVMLCVILTLTPTHPSFVCIVRKNNDKPILLHLLPHHSINFNHLIAIRHAAPNILWVSIWLIFIDTVYYVKKVWIDKFCFSF